MSAPSLRKALGQHHLRHPELCRPLVGFLARGPRRVLEIGPGGGVLTGALLAAGFEVLAVELDPAWAFHLRSRVEGRLHVAVADAMDLEWSRLAAGASVAGNLPYGIATALLRRMLEPASAVGRAAFLVQREVAERLVAQPGARAYGALSVLVALRAQVTLLARVRPGSFVPPPRVESAFVGLEVVAAPVPDAELPELRALIRACFAGPRKTLRNNLAAWLGAERAEALLGAAGEDRLRRAGTLSREEFIGLHRLLRSMGSVTPAADAGGTVS